MVRLKDQVLLQLYGKLSGYMAKYSSYTPTFNVDV